MNKLTTHPNTCTRQANQLQRTYHDVLEGGKKN
ncbi:MAG: hypothetical protein ACI90V_007645 [Bacillariaceae sp.]|jgi:hypothetical protein